jgi:predicted dehydrogenase
MCIEALKSGKHVLCEKPLARTPEECRRILDAANENKRFIATGFNYRFFPSVQKARALLDSGLIGELDHIRSYAGYSAGDHTQPWLHDPQVTGGGALRDNGIHLIDLTLYFLGEVVEVSGFNSNSVWGFNGCEDNGFVLLRSSEGRIASLQASWTEWRGYRHLIEIYGARGCIRAWCFPMVTQAVWAVERGGRTRRKTYLFPMTHIMEHLRSYRWVCIQSFIKELDAFARSSRGETSALASGRDGLRAVEIASAAHTLKVTDQAERVLSSVGLAGC